MWHKLMLCFACAAILAVVGCGAKADLSALQARAEQGNANAQFVLGLRYYNGDGVTKSFVEADKWFLIAKASAHELASAASKEVAKKMKPAQVAEAEARAKQWQDAFKLSHSAKE